MGFDPLTPPPLVPCFFAQLIIFIMIAVISEINILFIHSYTVSQKNCTVLFLH